MTSSIVLSVETRSQIPLLSNFDNEDGETIELNQPLVSQVANNVDPTTLSDSDLRQAIITAAYIGTSSKVFVDELIWREGESQSLWCEDRVNPSIETAIYNEIASLYPGIQDAITRCDKNVKHECHELAGRGALRMLKYERENNCPWNEYTCSNSA